MKTNHIRKLREEKGIKLWELAEQAGISIGYLCHLEKGTRKNPSFDVMNNISQALGKNILEVFGE